MLTFRQAIFRTSDRNSCINHFRMTVSRNLINYISIITSRTVICCEATLSTSGIGNLYLVAVTQCTHIAILVRIVTSFAGMRGVALLCTSRGSHDRFIGVTQFIEHRSFNISAQCTLSNLHTVRCTSRCSINRPSTIAVTQSVYRIGSIGITADSASIGSKTFRRTGRCCHDCFVIMTNCIYMICGVGIITDSAGIGSITFRRTGRFRNNCVITMAQSRNFLLCNRCILTTSTMLAFGQTGFSTGRCLGCILYHVMAQRIHLVYDATITTDRTCIRSIAFLFTSRCRYNGHIAMTACIHAVTNIGITTISAGISGVTTGSTARRSNNGIVAMLQSICFIILIGIAASTTSIGSITVSRTSRCSDNCIIAMTSAFCFDSHTAHLSTAMYAVEYLVIRTVCSTCCINNIFSHHIASCMFADNVHAIYKLQTITVTEIIRHLVIKGTARNGNFTQNGFGLVFTCKVRTSSLERASIDSGRASKAIDTVVLAHEFAIIDRQRSIGTNQIIAVIHIAECTTIDYQLTCGCNTDAVNTICLEYAIVNGHFSTNDQTILILNIRNIHRDAAQIPGLLTFDCHHLQQTDHITVFCSCNCIVQCLVSSGTNLCNSNQLRSFFNNHIGIAAAIHTSICGITVCIKGRRCVCCLITVTIGRQCKHGSRNCTQAIHTVDNDLKASIHGTGRRLIAFLLGFAGSVSLFRFNNNLNIACHILTFDGQCVAILIRIHAHSIDQNRNFANSETITKATEIQFCRIGCTILNGSFRTNQIIRTRCLNNNMNIQILNISAITQSIYICMIIILLVAIFAEMVTIRSQVHMLTNGFLTTVITDVILVIVTVFTLVNATVTIAYVIKISVQVSQFIHIVVHVTIVTVASVGSKTAFSTVRSRYRLLICMTIRSNCNILMLLLCPFGIKGSCISGVTIIRTGSISYHSNSFYSLCLLIATCADTSRCASAVILCPSIGRLTICMRQLIQSQSLNLTLCPIITKCCCIDRLTGSCASCICCNRRHVTDTTLLILAIQTESGRSTCAEILSPHIAHLIAILVAICIQLIIHISVTTCATGVSRITSISTSRLCNNLIIAMAGSCIQNITTNCANLCSCTGSRVSGRMTCSIYNVLLQNRFTANATMLTLGQTRLRTCGRNCCIGHFCVAISRYDHILTADFSRANTAIHNAVISALFGAVRRHLMFPDCHSGSMTSCIYDFGSSRRANRTGKGLYACGFASGGGSNLTCIHAVSICRNNLLCHQHFVTAAAVAAFFQASFRTSGIHRFIRYGLMPQRILLVILIAIITILAFMQIIAGSRTSRCNDLHRLHIMTLSINSNFLSTGTDRTSIYGFTRNCTSCICRHAIIPAVAQRIHGFVLGSAASAAMEGLDTLALTSRSGGDFAIVPSVTGCSCRIRSIAVATTAAGMRRVAVSLTAGCSNNCCIFMPQFFLQLNTANRAGLCSRTSCFLTRCVTQCCQSFILGCATYTAGIGFLATIDAIRRSCHLTFVPSMAQSLNHHIVAHCTSLCADTSCSCARGVAQCINKIILVLVVAAIALMDCITLFVAHRLNNCFNVIMAGGGYNLVFLNKIAYCTLVGRVAVSGAGRCNWIQNIPRMVDHRNIFLCNFIITPGAMLAFGQTSCSTGRCLCCIRYPIMTQRIDGHCFGNTADRTFKLLFACSCTGRCLCFIRDLNPRMIKFPFHSAFPSAIFYDKLTIADQLMGIQIRTIRIFQLCCGDRDLCIISLPLHKLICNVFATCCDNDFTGTFTTDDVGTTGCGIHTSCRRIHEAIHVDLCINQIRFCSCIVFTRCIINRQQFLVLIVGSIQNGLAKCKSTPFVSIVNIHTAIISELAFCALLHNNFRTGQESHILCNLDITRVDGHGHITVYG